MFKLYREIRTDQLAPGMVLAQNVVGHSGRIIFTSGMIVTEKIIRVLLDWDIESVSIEPVEDA